MKLLRKKNKSKIEYLALPYMHANKYIVRFRASVSDIIAADLMKQGRFIFAPITMCHDIVTKYSLPGEWEFWAEMDKEFIRMCGRFLIITLKGWEDSVGVTAETKLARKYGLEIDYIDPEPYFEHFEKSFLQYMKELTKEKENEKIRIIRASKE